MQKYSRLLVSLVLLLVCRFAGAQQETPFVAFDVPTQNLVKFNRFLINPTFSTVRENKSYINLFHRNQSVSFDDNNQIYFLSYSGRIGDRSGVGLSLYTQREGLIENFGLLANYAYGIKLSDKSNFTFGGNFSYYNSGLNTRRANPVDDDPLLNGLDATSLITFQPGFNISYGAFDFGVLANNLFDYNLKTSESLTDFNEKTFTGHLQYTHQFKNAAGIFENARLMPLARVQTGPVNDLNLGGSLILDLPKLGWLQAGYDDFYGAAAGIGFNLNKRISLGYTVEKGLSDTFQDFGVNHEISLAFSFTPNLTEDRVLLEKDNEDLVENTNDEVPTEELSLTEKDLKIAQLEEKLAENNSILDELLFRQDSIEKAKQGDLERRFNLVMRMVRRETQGEDPELEALAKQMYFANLDTVDFPNKKRNTIAPNTSLTNTTASKTAIQLPTANGATQVAAVDGTNEPQETTTKAQGAVIQLPRTEETQRMAAIKDTSAPLEAAKKSSSLAQGNRKARVSTATKKTTRFNPVVIPNVQSGHYLIANVYKGKKYMYKFMDELKAKGLDANYFTNPKNGMNYVYIKEFSSKQDAVDAYKTGLNGNYQGDTWIMKVNAADASSSALAYHDGSSNTISDNNSSETPNDAIYNDTSTEAKGKPAYKTYHINGLGNGFYIIANVFAKHKNAKKFVKELRDRGFEANYFIHPKNNYRYVYITKHQEWTNALISYYSKINDSYHGKLWVMRVKANQTA